MDLPRSPKTDKKVTVETLLQLKRYERPSDDFWSRFDRDLEKRRLQSIVKREPWYRRAFAALVLRPQPTMLMGAASVLAIGVFLYQGFSPQGTATSIESSPVVADSTPVDKQPDETNAFSPVVSSYSGLAMATRQPARISISDADFGVDVIMPRPDSHPMRSFRMDLEPSTFAVPQDKALSYFTDSLSLKPRSVSIPISSGSY